jgi:hypothetical protein
MFVADGVREYLRTHRSFHIDNFARKYGYTHMQAFAAAYYLGRKGEVQFNGKRILQNGNEVDPDLAEIEKGFLEAASKGPTTICGYSLATGHDRILVHKAALAIKSYGTGADFQKAHDLFLNGKDRAIWKKQPEDYICVQNTADVSLLQCVEGRRQRNCHYNLYVL